MDGALDRAAIEARLPTRLLGCRLEVHAQIDSTNTRAVKLAQEGAPEGTLVLADVQTHGRGRLSRRWFAPPASSLLVSLVLRPPLAPDQAQRSTMVCALGIVGAVAQVCGLRVQIKWPNDIVLQGKKLGGLLTELGLRDAELDYAVVGMGLNVNLDVSSLPDLLSPATSLSSALGRPVARLDLLVAVLAGIEARYERLLQGWSPLEEWREHLSTLGHMVRVSSAEEEVEGLAEDVDSDGALVVRLADGRRRVLAGDVTLRGHVSTEGHS